METSNKWKLKLSQFVYTPYPHFVTWCHAHLHITEMKCSKFQLFRWLENSWRSFELQDSSNNSKTYRLSVDSSIPQPLTSLVLSYSKTWLYLEHWKKTSPLMKAVMRMLGGHLTPNLSVMSSNTIKSSCWTLLLLLSTGWIRELIPAWFHNQT